MAYPSYIDAFNSGLLKEKAEQAMEMLKNCAICPRRCKVNRLMNKTGFCRTAQRAIVCSYFAHHGEEPPISGENGSGTIFFARCNLKCVYCQNYEFSQLDEGREVTPEELCSYMLELQGMNCHNINLVTPTHIMPQILEALYLAAGKGLKLPIVYNTSGYELPEMIKFLEGIVDIYMPDMRYSQAKTAGEYSSAEDYPHFNQGSVEEMFKQTGIGVFDKDGMMKRGLIIRHLVLPNNLAGTDAILAFISEKLSPEIHISLMSQYEPVFKAGQYLPINRKITLQEYEEAESLLKKYGLKNGWVQESGGLKRFEGTNIKRNI